MFRLVDGPTRRRGVIRVFHNLGATAANDPSTITISVNENGSQYDIEVPSGAFTVTIDAVEYNVNTADIIGQPPLILADPTATDVNGGDIEDGDTLDAVYAPYLFDPAGGVPVDGITWRRADTEIDTGDSHDVVPDDLYYGLDVRQTVTNGYGTSYRESEVVEAIGLPSVPWVVADGTNDYMRKASGFTGAADSKTGLLVYAVNFGAISAAEIVVSANDNASGSFRSASGYVSVTWKNTSGVNGFALQTNNNSETNSKPGDELCVIAARMDADGTNRLYMWTPTLGAWSLRGSLAGGGVNFDWTQTWTFLARESSFASKFGGQIGRIALWTGVNWASFAADSEWLDTIINSGTGELINPATSVAALGTPLLDIYGDAAVWNAGTNQGSGGNLTVTGAFVDV